MRVQHVKVDRDGSVNVYSTNIYELEDMKDRTRKYTKILAEHFKKHKVIYSTSAMALTALLYPTTGFAAETNEVGGKGLIILLQKASFWLGMGVAIWGIVESMLGFPGWKGRIAKGIIGYVAILLIPLVFFELQEQLMTDVWKQIERGK